MKVLRIALRLVPAALCSIIIAGSGVYLYLGPQLPSVEVLRDVKLQTPMRVYTRDGELIGQFGEQKRNPLPYHMIPPMFVKALLSAEDDGFFEHSGIDIASLARAVSELVMTGQKGSGGSTLTMQVARNYFLTLERTFTRKFKEILLSLEIERTLNKEEIFELYFNQVFLGHRAYGFEAAAQVYYGAHIAELNVAQLAMLAGLPKAPSRYNPISNAERALVRRNWILGRMKNLAYIDDASYQAALDMPVSASHHGAKLAFDAPYAAEMARKEMIRRYGVAAYNDGYHVFTSIDSRLQKAANQAVQDGLFAYDQRHGYRGAEQKLPAPDPALDMHSLWLSALQTTPVIAAQMPAIVMEVGDQHLSILLADDSVEQVLWEDGLSQVRPYIDENRRGGRPVQAADIWQSGDLIRVRRLEDQSFQLSQVPAAQAALVSLDANNGGILSIVGGLGFSKSKFNRATQATRQPGSNFKPFIYSAAMENGFTAASIINDAPVVFEDAALEDTWRPENDGGKFYGPTRLRWALTKSRNLVSIRLLQQLGVRKAIAYAGRFGFDANELAADLGLALGTHSITPIQLVSAYSSLANGGYKIDPWIIGRVEDFYRNTAFSAQPMTVCKPCEQGDNDPEAADIELSMEDILAAKAHQQFPQAPRIIDEHVAFLIDSILQDVITKGTGRRARVLERGDIAGKTGTTNGPTDAWFSGYNPDVVTTTWLGFDQNLELGRNEFGGSAALPIWIDFMRVALADKPDLARRIPDGMVTVRIDPASGLLARPAQKDAIFEYFRADKVPSEINSADSDSLVNQAHANLQEKLF